MNSCVVRCCFAWLVAFSSAAIARGDALIEFFRLPADTTSIDLSQHRFQSHHVVELKRFPKLETLTLRGPHAFGWNNLNAQDFAEIAKLKSIKHLHVSAFGFEDDVATHLASMKNLETLNVSANRLTVAGFRKLQALPNLKVLNVGVNPHMKAEDISVFAKFSKLESLDVNYTVTPSDASLAQLGQLTNLKYLRISRLGSGVTEKGIRSLAGMKRLKELNVRFTGRIDRKACLEIITQMTSLELLHLSSINGINNDDFKKLGRLKNLRSLRLVGLDRIDAEGFATLGNLTELRWLSLYSMRELSNDAIVHLAKLKKLEYLHLTNHSGLTPTHTKIYYQLRALKELQLQLKGNTYDQELFEWISSNPSIEKLNLWGVDRIDADSLRKIVRARNLKQLTLNADSLNDDKLRLLKLGKQLKYLAIRGKGSFSKEAIAELKADLPHCQLSIQ